MCKKLDKRSEQGQVLVWTVIMLPLLLALVGLVFDGGFLWVQFRRARGAADGAAVAAASDIDGPHFLDTGQIRLTDNAIGTAMHYAGENYPNLYLTRVYVADNVVYVDGRAVAQPVFLSMFGVGDLIFDVHAEERPIWGISQTGQ